MNKRQKKFFGILGLGAVALMTIFAIMLPDEASAAPVSDSHTDVIRVTVYDQKPTVTFVSPSEGYTQSNPLFNYHLSYSYTQHLYFDLSYWVANETTGEPELVTTPFYSPTYATDGNTWAFTPSDLDPTFDYASGELNVEFNLATCKSKFGDDAVVDIPNCEAVREGGIHFDSSYLPSNDNVLGYNCYGLTATVTSGGGIGTSDTYFCYVPSSLVQTGSDPDNNDPVVTVTTDTGAAAIGLYFFDKDGNQINSDPFMLSRDSFVLVDPVTGEVVGNANPGSASGNTGSGTGTGTGTDPSGTGSGTGTDPSGTGSGTGTSGGGAGTGLSPDTFINITGNNTGRAIVTLPFGSYGLPTGDYLVQIVAYDVNGNVIPSPERLYYQDSDGNLNFRTVGLFPVTYVQPQAPAIPDTGRFLGNLGVSRSDYIATYLVVFAFALGLSFFIITKSKKNYRKNLRLVKTNSSRSYSRRRK